MGQEPDRRPSSGRRPIYVEISIRTPMDRLWTLTQDTDLHPGWDLRFTRIVPTTVSAEGLLRFRYEFRLPFHTITGTGTSMGHKHRTDGQSTSVLKFTTSDALSPIGPGSGYWRYIPSGDSIRFITGYNYQPGMGFFGKTLDSHFIRPALGWATALSFDRLRLWAESGLDPRLTLNRWILDAAARTGGVAVAAVLLRRALGRRRPVAGIIAVAAVVAASLLFPAHRTVPRASRCLRRPPDDRSAQAPSALHTLPEPEAEFSRDHMSEKASV